MRSSYRYSHWDGSQDYLNLDGSQILEEIADDLIYHGDVTAALRRLLRNGLTLKDGNKIPGIREILNRIKQKKNQLSQDISSSDFFGSIKQQLEEIINIEQSSLSQLIDNLKSSSRQSDKDSIDALQLRQIQLASLPDFLPDKISSLSNYDFTSIEAYERFEELMQKLKKEILDAYFNNITKAFNSLTEKDLNRIREALSNLNRMIEQKLEGKELDPSFEEFMQQYGDMFDGNPSSLEELLSNLAQRSAMMSSLIASMTPQQQAILSNLSSQLLSNLDIAFEADRLSENLRKMLPNLNWDSPLFNREINNVSSITQSLKAASDLSTLKDLESLLSENFDFNLLKELDWDSIRNLLGKDTENALKTLSNIAEILKKEGLIDQKGSKLSLSPKAIRKLGGNVLDKIFAKLSIDKQLGHQILKEGFGTEYLGTSKKYEFGDPFDLDLSTTLYQSLSRNGKGTPVKITPDDFFIKERDSSTRSSTVVMIDLSLSMPMRENFLPAKKVALAIYHLIKQKFPKDYVGLVGFSEVAHEIKPENLPSVSWDFVYGTNIAHGLALARKMLGSQSGTKQIIMITDGEPTAHLTSAGEVFFSYPPTRETLRETLLEVARCTKKQITINSFVLDVNPYLVSFINKLAQINKGRVFYVTPENLEDFVLIDFLARSNSYKNPRSSKISRRFYPTDPSYQF
jgi:uncharacterized protein with von Willebrand factor type A (vWA) domain